MPQPRVATHASHPNGNHVGILRTTASDSRDDTNSPVPSNQLQDLKVTISGAGPTGLLLAHLLLQKGAARVTLYESRPDPRLTAVTGSNPNNIQAAAAALAGFAYALGLGIRGRSAIQAVDQQLWHAVKQRGNECDRFRLQAGPFNIKLRDSPRKRQKLLRNKVKSNGQEPLPEPSLLLFQVDLCIALLNELERRHGTDGGRLQLNFGSRIVDCDLEKRRIVVDSRNKNETIINSYDLLVGCDGVNSVVRNAMSQAAPTQFAADKKVLPGEFKVARLDTIPPKMDPNAVSLILPKKGSTTLFLEPTVNGSCCILFAGRGGADNPILSANSTMENKTEILAETLVESFPLLTGADLKDVAEQLLTQKPGSASSVTCNVYHYFSSAAIAGDAAHATGGVSGQGVNSALLDAVALRDCLLEGYDPSNKQESLVRCLVRYSQRQVPEGKALYDLSFGPKPRGFKRILYLLRGVRDTIFQGRLGIGKPPLQTMLTTSMVPFSSIRRRLDFYYDSPFPETEFFNNEISLVYQTRNQPAGEK